MGGNFFFSKFHRIRNERPVRFKPIYNVVMACYGNELLVRFAKNLADRLAKSLMLKYGCRLTEGEVCRGYELKVDDPVVKLLARYFCVSTPERKIDHSPGWDQGELENLSRDAAVEYLLMRERVKKLEGQVQALHVDLEELTGALKKLLSVEPSDQFGPEQKRLQDYVS